MQTKKRAKPVKFGKTAKVKKENEAASNNADEKKVDKEIEEKVEKLKAKEEAEEKDAGKRPDTYKSSKIDDVDGEDELRENKEDAPDIEDGVDDGEDDFEKESEDKIEEEALTDEEIIESESDEDDLSDDEIFAKPPDVSDNKRGAFGYFMKVVITTFIIALILFVGGYYAYTNQDRLLSFVSSPSPTPSAPPPATPTPEPVDLAEFNIIVLNGTDVAGLAGDAREQLEDAGFSVISVGNADDDFEETQIQAVEAVSEEFLQALEDALSENFTIGETTTLSTGEADVIINLGSPSAEAE